MKPILTPTLRRLTPMRALPMMRLLRSALSLALIAAAPGALAFSLLGPIGNAGDAYQTDTLSYNLPGDIGAPKNLGEEYRLNTPQVYYAADSTFLDYFGSNGLRAVDQAFAVYNTLTNVSDFTPDLTEFPLDSQRVNFLAQSFNLLDLKSMVMAYIIEHMGLAEPDRWTWALRARISTPVQCIFEYHVIMRNFDPITWEYSRFVNGTRYSYIIIEGCPDLERADAAETIVDPLQPAFTAVASQGLIAGGFYSSITRDDAGGLRYLYHTNNANVEVPPQAALFFQTNLNPTLIYGSNLTELAANALTNDAAALQTLYPGLVVLSSSNYFVTVRITNSTTYLTNYPWQPVGTPPVIHTNQSVILVPQARYRHLLANVEVIRRINGRLVTVPAPDVAEFDTFTRLVLQTTSIGGDSPWTPIGSANTNITQEFFFSNVPAGEYFILPTNACAINILSPLATFVTPVTNIIFVNTNIVVDTNQTTGSNGVVGSQVLEQAVIQYFTNHAFLIQEVLCVTNDAALRQGIEKVTFIRRDYDSLLGRFFLPITNDYKMTAITGNRPVEQHFRRILNGPDILVQAGDLDILVYARTINFNSTNTLGGLAGPGSIEPFSLLTLAKTGPVRIHIGPGSEDTAIATNFVWGSFDASTNDIIVYPKGSSLMDLEEMIIIDIEPPGPDLPDGFAGFDYGEIFDGFTVTGGEAPYTWEIVGNLPAGLVLQPAGNVNQFADLFGVPVSAGTRTIVVRVTDAGGRFIELPYRLRIR